MSHPHLAIVLIVLFTTKLWANIDLVNAENTNSVINTLNNFQTDIDLNAIGERELNIKYTNSNGQIAFVEFFINDRKVSFSNQGNPYYMYTNGEAWLPIPGSFTVMAKAYSNTNALIDSESVVINFTDDLSHRMRKVYISTGIPNKEIQIAMKKHAFIFGSQTVEEGNLNPNETKPYPVRISGYEANTTQMGWINEYREVFLDNFNFSVAGNAMKWYSMGTNGIDFTRADRWYDWHTANGIPVRGHTLLWGKKSSTVLSQENMHDPQWIEDLMEGTESQKEQAKAAIINRIETVVGHYAGKIDEWDFNNELWNYDHYRRQFDGQTNWRTASHAPSGPSILAEFAQAAIDANPNIKLYHNDYNIITQSGTGNATSFKNLLIDLRDNHGVPVDGIGVQGHFGNTARSKEHLTNCFNILDDVGVPIKITELDIGSISSSEAAKANQLENVFRAAFEHNAVEGIIFWGFWSGCHWRDYRAPWQYEGYDKNNKLATSDDDPTNWIETDQVTRYRGLVFDEWWTDAVVETDESGNVELAVFAGDFDVIIDGITYTKTISVNEDEEPYYLSYSNGELSETDGEFKIIQPFNNENFALNEAIEIKAAYPNGSTTGITEVEFYINGALNKRDSVSPFQMTWYDAPEGVHTLSIIAQGNTEVQDSLAITVASSQLETSLIDNSGFESGGIDSGLIAFGPVSLTIANSQAYAGNNSLRVQRDSTSAPLVWHGARFNLSGSNATDSLEVGATYQFSSKVYLDEPSANLALTIKELTDPIVYNAITDYSNGVQSQTWVDLSAQFVYQDYMDFIYIAGVDAGVNFYVDEISISKIAPIVNPEDTDSDGMLDSWEQSSFGNLDSLPNDDADNDGLSNLLEFRSGTNPNNQFSQFRYYAFSHLSDNNQIQWLGSSEKLYRILATSDLSLNQWEVLEEAIQGDISTLNTWTENHLGASAKFYKVEIDD